MSTKFNTFVEPITTEDTRYGVAIGLNKAIDKWLTTINGREVERSQPAYGMIPFETSKHNTITIPGIMVTVKAEVISEND